jgi:holliday junction DNA helicase RuvA
MIAFLTGNVLQKFNNNIILNVNGVGYEVHMPSSKIILYETGSKINLFIHTHVKEDSIELFGFSTIQERQFFKIIIGISGIGPRLGLTILDTMDPQDLINTIRLGNSRLLTKIPGIGTKTAERIVLELKNKQAIKNFSFNLNQEAISPISIENKSKNIISTANTSEETIKTNKQAIFFDDTINALVSLGYKDTEATQAVRSIMKDEIIDLSQAIKMALKELSA